jgi:hypothetical protein
MAKKPYYAVAKGRTVGLFTLWYSYFHMYLTDWPECEKSVKGFSGAIYKGFNSREEALSYIAAYKLREKHGAESARSSPSAPTVALPPTPQPPRPLFDRMARESFLNARTFSPSAGGRVEAPSTSVDGTAGRPSNPFTRIYEREMDFVDVVERMYEDDSAGAGEALDGSSPSRPFCIDDDDGDEPTSPIRTSAPAKRRRSDTVEEPPKRAKYQSMDIEIIDLTSSPPNKPNRNDVRNRPEQRYPPLSPPSSSPTEFLSSSDQSDNESEFDVAPPPPQEYSSMHRRAKSGEKQPPKAFTLADCSPEQQKILDLVSGGKNIFFTGSAGVGKSFVLQKICEMFKSQGMKQFDKFFITASTGTHIL